ncbi:hypothetical protein [Lysinibacillus pakistanensis]|uniref:Swarming motility protein SwrB n=1 Tax=Lysinibacillus pakistanensis TaxID=759811 RepID=A0ABX6D9Y5_9BACI|nr:hypothetical protein GDS87_05490 [Lysinibacillus pakistanensis]
MATILITILFFLQLLSFYFLIILNTKLAKFKDLEKKQERLMREMDDTISVYLADMKDENDRLIQELHSVSKSELNVNAIQQAEKIVTQKEQEPLPEKMKKEQESPNLEADSRKYIPKNIVASAYSRQQQSVSKAAQSDSMANETEKEQPKVFTMEQQAIELAKQGKTPEEIAKQLQKGKTEIELLLKFHG